MATCLRSRKMQSATIKLPFPSPNDNFKYIYLHYNAFFHIFIFQSVLLALIATAFSNVKPDASQSLVTFHNDVDFATVDIAG